MNLSEWTNAPSTPESSTAWVQAVQMFHEAYIYPFFVLAGVVANSFIVVAFSFPTARRCGRTTRLYYVLIALSDTVRLIEWDLGVNFIEYGLVTLTGGKITLETQTLSDFTCKLFHYVFYVVEMVSDYTLLVFSVERAYFVLYPLEARHTKCSGLFLTLLGAAVVASLGVNALVLVSVVRYTNPGNNAVSCFADSNHTLLFVLNSLLFALVVLALPTLLLALTNTAIIAGLLRARRLHNRLVCRMLGHSGVERLPVVGSSATFTLVFIALFQCVVYLPFSIIALLYGLLATNLVNPPDAVTTVNVIFAYLFFLDATVYCKDINIVVYYFRIPYFRNFFNRIFLPWVRLKTVVYSQTEQ